MSQSVDSRTIPIDLEKELKTLKGIGQIAVLATEDPVTVPAVHLSHFFSDWKSEQLLTGSQTSASTSHHDERDETLPLAYSFGGELQLAVDEPGTLVEVLLRAARIAHDKKLVFVQLDGSEVTMTYAQLLQEAESILWGLRQQGLQPGDPVIFQLDHNKNFVTAFWACVLGGFLPTPIAIAPTYTDWNSGISRIYNAWKLLQKPLVLADEALIESIDQLKNLWETDELRYVALEPLLQNEPDQQYYEASPDSLVLHLLTSGSTGIPKCVQHCNESILARARGTVACHNFTSDEIILNWMPLDHVGGIVMFHVLGVYLASEQILPKIDSFIANPLNWFNWINHYRATMTWAPNFAFALVNDQAEKIKQNNWDLSCMRHILNGGEPVVSKVVQQFLSLLQPHGLPDDTMAPSFGMSETSSGIVFNKLLNRLSPTSGYQILDKASLGGTVRSVPVDHPNHVMFTEVGGPIPGVSIRIVDSNNNVIRENQIGRLQVKGNNIMVGYYQNPEANAEVFVEDGWFITGDLGFLHQGRLTITGREKDVIIINGNNIHNYEIESFVEEVKGVKVTFSAAVSIPKVSSGSDELAIFFVPEEPDLESCLGVIKEIRRHLNVKMGLNPALIVPITQEEFPKTNSGKIQRPELSRRLAKGEFDEILKQIDLKLENDNTLPSWFYKPVWVESPAEETSSVNMTNIEDMQLAGHCLLMIDSMDLASKFVVGEMDEGECISVTNGKEFSKISRLHYVANFNKPHDLDQLFGALKEEQLDVSHVFYLHGMSNSVTGNQPQTIDELKAIQEHNYAIVHLAKVMADRNLQPSTFSLVTHNLYQTNDMEMISYAYSPLIGFFKTLPHEFPETTFLHIDFSDDVHENYSLYIKKELNNLLALAKLAQEKDETDYSKTAIVAYRGNKRYSPRITRVELENKALSDSPLRQNGFYLITGGLGGVAKLFTEHLLRHCQAKVLLVGRTTLPDNVEEGYFDRSTSTKEKMKCLKELKSLAQNGGEVHYVACNIADPVQLEAIVAEWEERFGQALNGVIHLAGVYRETLLKDETMSTLDEMFRAKVYGTFALYQLLKNRPNSIYITSSSTTTLSSGYMAGAYAAANQFVESFSQQMQASGDVKTYCFAWSLWDDIGMGRDLLVMKKILQSRGHQAIRSVKGLYSWLIGLMANDAFLYVGIDESKPDMSKLLAVEPKRQKILHLFFQLDQTMDLTYQTLREKTEQILLTKNSGEPILVALHETDEWLYTETGEPDSEAMLVALAKKAGDVERIKPRSPLENALFGIWSSLLGTDDFGVHDNFFALGGQSIKATQLLTQVREMCQVDLPLRVLFANPTIEELAKELEHQMGASPCNTEEQRKITKAVYGNTLPMSNAQKRQWYLYQLNPESPYYNNTVSLHLKGEKLHVHLLSQAVQLIVDRHEILRTRFALQEDEAVQIIDPKQVMEVPLVDLTHLPLSEREQAVQAHIRQEATTPFHLEKDQLIRAVLIRAGDDDHVMVVSIHHIVSDGWSVGVFIEEIANAYDQMRAGKRVELPELPIQYADYTLWQQNLLSDELIVHQLTYWKNKLADATELQLPTDYPRPVHPKRVGKTIERNFSSHLRKKLEKLSQQEGATLYMTLLSSFLTLLSRYSGQRDVIVSSVTANRNQVEIERLIGFFVNTLAIRADIDMTESFADLLQKVKAATLEAFDNQDVPFEMVVDELSLERRPHLHPLSQVLFIVQNAKMRAIDLADATMTMHIENSETSKFDITVQVFEAGEDLQVMLEYDTELYRDDTMERMLSHFERLLTAISEDVAQPLSQITFLSDADIHLLSAFNQTEMDYPRDLTLHQQFEQQVDRSPDAVAVVEGDGVQTITYKELNRRANQLAVHLRTRGVKANQVVGLMADRSIKMLTGLLAILKAGGAFLPIDPALPKERISYMLENSGSTLLLTDRDMADLPFNGDVIKLDNTAYQHNNADNLECINTSSDLLYAIYTSGTTGHPKGIMLTHRNLSNIVQFEYNRTTLDFRRVLQFTTMSFDVCYQEIFSTLLAGGELHIIGNDDKRDILKLLAFIEEYRLETAFLPTSLFKFIINESYYVEKLPKTLKHLVVAGEQLVLPESFIAYLHQHDIQLHNHYGPSETHVITSLTMKAKESIMGIPPIGRPIANTRIFIVSEEMQLQPVGVPGELCVSGDTVGLGYLNRKELTAEKFVINPFAPDEIMYRTGDIARWLPDGTIEYLGRIDHQIKIRGYRIEPGEIEIQLLNHPLISKAFVMVYQNGANASLCGYYVAEEALSPEAVHSYLAESLPDYMVPAYLIPLNELPLNHNGKIDRRALPIPDSSMTMEEYVDPSNETEETLTEIWSEVLGVENVSVTSNFFKIGGHSLKATMLVARIHKHFGIEFPLKEVFHKPTIQQMAGYIEQAAVRSFTTIESAPAMTHYPVTSAQKRLYVISQFDGVKTGYNMPVIAELRGNLDKERLRQALEAVVLRHDTLRTSYEMMDGVLVQRIHESADVSLEIVQLQTTEAVSSADRKIHDLISNAIQPFHLRIAPQLRATLIELAPEHAILVVDMHHIAADGVSLNIFMNDLGAYYQGKSLPPLHIQYKDYAVWKQSYLGSEENQQHEAYWLDIFTNEPPVLELPTDFQRPSVQSFEGDRIWIDQDEDWTAKLKALATSLDTTLYMLLLAIYNVFLSKWTNQEDIIVGSPIAGRPHADVEPIMGMFVNTLALRNYPEANKSFSQFVAEVKEHVLQAHEHQDYPLEELIEKLGIRRDLSRNPLFDTMFTLQNVDIDYNVMQDVQVSAYDYQYPISKFDLTLLCVEKDGRLRFEWEYSTKLFTRETIVRMSKHLIHLLEQIIEQPQLSIVDIELITEAEKTQLLHDFNRTEWEHPVEQTIHALIEKQALLAPDQTAVVFRSEALTYQQLNEKANQLAHTLREKGAGPEQVIAIMADRSLEMFIGLLAILKAGAAFVPIDPEYPAERIQYMLDDSQAKLLLHHTNQDVKLDAYTREVIRISDQASYQRDIANLPEMTQPSNLAYIIYTSGSTGKPKGVMIEHRSLVNLCFWHRSEYGITADDATTKYAGFGFDASVWEIFPYLISGATIHVIGDELRYDIHKLNEYYEQNRITISFLPTQLCETFMSLCNRSLRYLLTGGDKLRTYDPQSYQLVNNYGPTENTVVATNCFITEAGSSIPIGKPIHNVKAYVLNSYNQLQPIGVPGELCVSGINLARGYWNKQELTDEKFVANPFATGERMYRTGDLVRWLPDGNLEYVGRMDAQVKIRGHRIELGEIETTLMQHPSVKEVAVVAWQDSNSNMLAAYFTVDSVVTTNELRKWLAQSLPDYMVPAYFIEVERLPLTANGKVDRKALPPVDKSAEVAISYKAPQNETDAILATIWQEVLGEERIGIQSNFYDLGGDSIKAIQVIALLNKHQLKVEIKDIFMNPTIEELSMYVKPLEAKADQGMVTGAVELTPIQRWFFAQKFTDSHHWNQAMMVYRRKGFDEQALCRVLHELVLHHDALRMSYEISELDIKQVNRGDEGCLYGFEVIDLSHLSAEKELDLAIQTEASRIQQSLDLTCGPLIHAGLFHTAEGDHLLLAIHHLVVDGVSWRILLEDLARGYEQAIGDQLIHFAEKTHSYQDWAEALTRYASTRMGQREMSYWQSVLQTTTEPIPKDATSSCNSWAETTEKTIWLSTKETEDLLKHAHHTYNTEINDILLTALGLTLSEWSGQTQIRVDLEGHGREEIIADISVARTVGWFTSIYPVVLKMNSLQDLGEQIKQMKESLRQIPNKGVGYGILNYLGETPLTGKQAEVSFNYLGQFDNSQQVGLFQASDKSVGEMFSPRAERTYLLDFLGMVTDGRLKLSVLYNTQIHQAKTIASLLERFKENLLRCILHCVSKQTNELTPSDFTSSGLSFDDLEAALDLFNR
ncbi:non-ribosomal peptide synthetase [Brevibacillus laterosporus]|uniref:non-ribosomal peptide synthetase n=1 Tax=Brevibacillus laterosporus TaxID=1465 RepID=UPI000EAC62FF|nr:non-ribosomal peptide synthetase [Brevibacillus laterosporus]AYK08267.1 amino acid adenylation domain-containing protein [Brevibacillus laterosporus]